MRDRNGCDGLDAVAPPGVRLIFQHVLGHRRLPDVPHVVLRIERHSVPDVMRTGHLYDPPGLTEPGVSNHPIRPVRQLVATVWDHFVGKEFGVGHTAHSKLTNVALSPVFVVIILVRGMSFGGVI